MTDTVLIAKLADECQAFISAAKGEAKHLIDVPWKNLIAHAETLLALAQQHNGGWRHLDRDAEKPDMGEKVLTSNGFLVTIGWYRKSEDTIYSAMDCPTEARWWKPLPAPPKGES